MDSDIKLQIGDVSDNGQITIIDEDRLCYVAFINDKGKWNVEYPPNTYVTKWMPIDCDESMETMLEYIKEITDNETD